MEASSCHDAFAQMLQSLGRGGEFNLAALSAIVHPNAEVVEEKKTMTGSAYGQKLKWMHENGYVCEGVSIELRDKESFVWRGTFVCGGKRFGQSKFCFVREGQVRAIRRSDEAADYLASHPFLPTAATASNELPDGKFGVLVVFKAANLTGMKNLRPIPAVFCVASYEPGPVQLFDKKNDSHKQQLEAGWRLGTMVVSRPCATARPEWSEEGLVIVSKPTPAPEDVLNVEVFDQTEKDVVFLGSCHFPVNSLCTGWTDFEDHPLVEGANDCAASISLSLKVVGVTEVPESGGLDNTAICKTAAESAKLRTIANAKRKPQYKKTTMEVQTIRGERIDLAVKVLCEVGKVAFEVTKFAVKVLKH